ncbi:MAG: hypothetical protein ACT4QC_16250 [Planctomycetaceae bacterium]
MTRDGRLVRKLFEEELRERGLTFEIDVATGRYKLNIGGMPLCVSLDNIKRQLHSDGDSTRVTTFVDQIVASCFVPRVWSPDQLLWCLETSDYSVAAEYSVGVSSGVNRVLIHISADGGLLTWVTAAMLDSLAMTPGAAAERAFANLARELKRTTIAYQLMDEIKLGYFDCDIPSKASLLLAPNLREVAGADLGWPLFAVAPDRDFVYLWDARHVQFVDRVGFVVVREFKIAPYPLSTEVFRIDDEGIRAIGAFAVEP